MPRAHACRELVKWRCAGHSGICPAPASVGRCGSCAAPGPGEQPRGRVGRKIVGTGRGFPLIAPAALWRLGATTCIRHRRAYPARHRACAGIVGSPAPRCREQTWRPPPPTSCLHLRGSCLRRLQVLQGQIAAVVGVDVQAIAAGLAGDQTGDSVRPARFHQSRIGGRRAAGIREAVRGAGILPVSCRRRSLATGAATFRGSWPGSELRA